MQAAKNGKKQENRFFFGHILAIEINDFLLGGNSGKTRSRVIPNILHLLDHIDKHRAEGNFYITPGLIRDFPEIVSLTASRGHEIGLCLDINRPGQLDNLKSSKNSLEKITNRPAYGIMLKSDTAKGRDYIRKLADLGFTYCLADFKMSLRGQNALPISIAYNNGTSIDIFPPSTYKFLGIELMFGMPGRIRLYPYWFLRECLRQFTHSQTPATVNFPLWEFDPHLPRQVLSPLQSIKSYGNLSLAEFKLTRMLLEFDFAKVTRIIGIEESEEN